MTFIGEYTFFFSLFQLEGETHIRLYAKYQKKNKNIKRKYNS